MICTGPPMADVWFVYENWRSPERFDAHMLLSAFTATSCILRLRISNPMEQNVEHESATQQTKRNKDGQRHGINYRQNLVPKRFRPMNQTLPKHLWRSPV
jgi:hypothetical protein